MTSKTTIKGEFACTKVEQLALLKGAIVSRPALETRYDRIIDWNGKLNRVQIKYASGKTRSSGAVAVKLDSNRFNPKKKKHLYDLSEIDAVLAYIPQLDKVCWFGPKFFVGKTSIIVRIAATKNNQKKNCIMADKHFW